nr:ATP-binding protein [Streptomyces sparsogenes]
MDDELAECVEVVASELVTNAVRHAGLARLAIVAALSKDWGHHARPLRGKVVWAEFSVP